MKRIVMNLLVCSCCLAADIGKELWHWPERPKFREDAGYNNVIGAYQSSPLIRDGLAVFSTADYAGLIVLDLNTGKTAWLPPRIEKTQAPAAGSSPCAWAHEGGWMVLGRGCAFDPATGDVRWKGLEHGWGTPAVEGDGCAVMGGKGLRVYRLTAKAPELLAEVPLDNGSGNPAILQGRVYACGARRLAPAKAAAQAGEVAPAPESPAGQPASFGVVICVDAANGKLLWETAGAQLNVGGGQWSFVSPMVASGVVCIPTDRLLLFSAADGKSVGSTTLRVPVLKCTSLALAGERWIARDYKAVVCYKTSSREALAESEGMHA